MTNQTQIIQERQRGLRVTLPYSVYRVPIADPWDRALLTTVDLSKNNQLRTGRRNQVLVREGKRQMAEDVGNLLKAEGWPQMRLPLRLNATVTTRTRARKDDDGVIVALYPARDTLADGFGINDSDIIVGEITFEVGEPEQTILEITETER